MSWMREPPFMRASSEPARLAKREYHSRRVLSLTVESSFSSLSSIMPGTSSSSRVRWISWM